ncbi:MAG: YhjD/YihY/BrkB family envelope integrity protein [Myxococcota bacterium]
MAEAHQESPPGNIPESASGSAAAAATESTPGPLFARIGALFSWLQRELWLDAPDEPFYLGWLRSTAQLIVLTARGFRTDQLMLRASALTYVSALSIIPMLGVVIAILGLVGGDETLVNFAIDQLTTVAPEVRETVRGYAAGLNLSSFGTIGGAVVFGTTILALRHLEQTLNEIWGVARSRSWPRRFSDYLAVMVVAPVSAGVAVSLGTALESQSLVAEMLQRPFFAQLYGLGLEQLPVFVLFLAFTFLYWFFPNTRVNLTAAGLGGLIAAVLFSAARQIYVDFQIGAATYQAVFGALSAVPLILAWLYACWAIILLGAEVAFAMQNLPYFRREMRAGDPSPAQSEAMALETAVAIGRAYAQGEAPPTADALADILDEPVRSVRRIVDALAQAGVLRVVLVGEEEDGAFVPALPLAQLTVGDVLRSVRGEEDHRVAGVSVGDASVGDTLRQLNQAWGEIADHTTIGTLVGPPV